MNFNSILTQMGEVEKSGKFDATTSSYFNYIDVSDTDVPPSINNGSNTTPLTKQEQEDYVKTWNQFSKEQAKVAREFQRQYPEFNVDSLYSTLKERGFKNEESDAVSAELQRKHGEKKLKAEDVERVSPDYYTLSNKLKYYDSKYAGKNYFDSYGATEGAVMKDAFGYKNLIQQRQPVGGKPYGEYQMLLRNEIDQNTRERNANR